MNFARFFVRDEPSPVGEANEILDWTRPIYFQKFMAYLDRGADEPLRVGDKDLIASVVRNNTFKEIRAHIRKQIAGAERILSEARGE